MLDVGVLSSLSSFLWFNWSLNFAFKCECVHACVWAWLFIQFMSDSSCETNNLSRVCPGCAQQMIGTNTPQPHLKNIQG